MAKRKRPRFPARRPGENDDHYLARLRELARTVNEITLRIGRPSTAILVIHAAHVALLRLTKASSATPSQRNIQDEVRTFLEEVRVTNAQKASIKDFVVPSKNTIRKHVQCYLRYRRGMTPQQLDQLPKDQREALESDQLPAGIHAACFIWLLGTADPVVPVIGSTITRRSIAVTRQIKAIKTLR